MEKNEKIYSFLLNKLFKSTVFWLPLYVGLTPDINQLKGIFEI